MAVGIENIKTTELTKQVSSVELSLVIAIPFKVISWLFLFCSGDMKFCLYGAGEKL